LLTLRLKHEYGGFFLGINIGKLRLIIKIIKGSVYIAQKTLLHISPNLFRRNLKQNYMSGSPTDGGLNWAVVSEPSVDEIQSLHRVTRISGRFEFVRRKERENRARPDCNVHQIFWVAVPIVGWLLFVAVTDFNA